jgi:AcrR family transcriptional regulator
LHPPATVVGVALPTALVASQAKRRRRILDEAQRLIAAQGEHAQIRDIAAGAGVALGTAYRYFGSKDRLYAEAYEQWCDDHSRHLARGMERGTTNTERVRLLAGGFFALYTEEPHMAGLVRHLRAAEDPGVGAVVHRCEQAGLALFRQALDGVAQPDADVIASIVNGIVRGAVDRLSSPAFTVEQARGEIARAVTMVLEFRDPTLDRAARVS